LGFWETDNPTVGEALSRFSPEVLVLFGYSHRTDWRALCWARQRGVRVLVFADSELKHHRAVWRRLTKEIVVRAFLSQVDGALPIGNCNADYYLHYGMPSNMLYWCAYPVDGSRFLALVDHAHEMRLAIRREWGIGLEEFVF